MQYSYVFLSAVIHQYNRTLRKILEPTNREFVHTPRAYGHGVNIEDRNKSQYVSILITIN